MLGVVENQRPRSIESRFEIKYLISEAQAAAMVVYLRPFMRLDRHARSHERGAYPIVSLYLDSDNLLLCRQTMTGEKNRVKLRVRSYTDDLDYPRFFEIKRRVNRAVIKSRVRVPAWPWRSTFRRRRAMPRPIESWSSSCSTWSGSRPSR